MCALRIDRSVTQVSGALRRLVRHAWKQWRRRPSGHLTVQLRHEMRCKDRAVEQVCDHDDTDDGQDGRPNRARRTAVGPHFDDGASFGIGSSEDVGEDHHHHAHGEGVVERVLVFGPLPQRQPGDHAAVVEDAEPCSQDPVEQEGPEEADDEPDTEKGGRPAPVEPRAQPSPSAAPTSAGVTK